MAEPEMEQWETGNFDSAGASQFLGELIEDLVEQIEDIFDDEDRFSLDDDAECILMPCVELVALLCERYDARPPKPKKIQKWHKKYLKMYDAQIDDLEPPDGYKEERRGVIDKTFNWLESVARTYHGE
jgi:hypothetical protein